MIFLVTFIICIIVIPVVWSYTRFALTDPLPMNYEMSWVILALISMVVLAYIQFINRLRDIFIDKKVKTGDDGFWGAAWQKILLSWTGLVLFLTILTLTFRIVLLSCIPKLLSEDYPECLSKQAIICSDYLLISSFIVGFIMRFWVYLEAHWKDFWHYLKKYYYGRL